MNANANEVPDKNELNKWNDNFAKNYPRTQEYIIEEMNEEIKNWNKALLMFVLTQATTIAMNFKIGKYNKYLLNKKYSQDATIDMFTYTYLKNATQNINNLWYACGDWNRVLGSVLSKEALTADCFVDRTINKYL